MLLKGEVIGSLHTMLDNLDLAPDASKDYKF